jgi:hypothetical protein
MVQSLPLEIALGFFRSELPVKNGESVYGAGYF